MSFSAYNKVYTVGHREIRDLFHQPVWAEEKIDGSQFSFGILDGKLLARSRGLIFDVEDPASYKQFALAVDYVISIASKLIPGYIYRGEYLGKRKQNTLSYDRVPRNNIVIWDILKLDKEYVDYAAKFRLARDLGLETTPQLTCQPVVIKNQADMDFFLSSDSMLGGCKVEGVVFKRLDEGGGLLAGKHVSERFKERNQTGMRNKGAQGSISTDRIVETYKTDARWEKAVQHLRDAGKLKEGPEDIGPLMKELSCDLSTECGDEIKELLFKYEWGKIVRGVSSGFPDWYKRQLAAKAFNG